MTWANDDLLLYHGTDDVSARKIVAQGVDLSLCNPLTDFGRGFYTTTNLEQAKNWAVLKAMKIRAHAPQAIGIVIELRVSRTWLGSLESLAFVREASETGFADFVRFCRLGGEPHRIAGNYQIVYGPVAQWQGIADSGMTLLVIKDCDQVSFHNGAITGHSSELLRNVKEVWSGV
jgi:Protein of unknown function (DUF3990)